MDSCYSITIITKTVERIWMILEQGQILSTGITDFIPILRFLVNFQQRATNRWENLVRTIIETPCALIAQFRTLPVFSLVQSDPHV